MRPLSESLRLNKKIRVLGFDDAPFQKGDGIPVKIHGILCSDTRFEGMLCGAVTPDGLDSTDCLIELICKSKFYPQVQVVLTDGLAFAGFNLIDLPRLAAQIQRPCIAVMRKRPDLLAIKQALQRFDDHPLRWTLIERAGQIYQHTPFFYQCSGCDERDAAQVLARLTDQGHVPEALRLAHLIGTAWATGESGKRA